jgi:uncharacterized protein with GYD domain
VPTSSQAPPASSYPFQIWVVNGGIDSGFKDAKQADQRCAEKNARAESMGLKARYEVRGELSIP